MIITIEEDEIERALTRWIHREVLGTCGNMTSYDVSIEVYEDNQDKQIKAECIVTKRKESISTDKIEDVVK